MNHEQPTIYSVQKGLIKKENSGENVDFFLLCRNGDHIHTNFKDMYQHLRNNGYFVEVLGKL